MRGATVELGRLVLLARAFRGLRAPEHPPGGGGGGKPARRCLPIPRHLAGPAGAWEVLSEHVRTRRDALVSQTTWLLNLGEGAPRFAMLLDFWPASAGRRGSVFVPGEQFTGELAFYPGRAAAACGAAATRGTR